ncbi:MAG: hypothetical protein ABI359_01440, partial [Ginsengibacter sp.]
VFNSDKNKRILNGLKKGGFFFLNMLVSILKNLRSPNNEGLHASTQWKHNNKINITSMAKFLKIKIIVICCFTGRD